MNIILTAIVLIAYELQLFYHLKPLFGFKKYQYQKPFDCFFCLSFWFNSILCVSLVLINNNFCPLQQWAVAILTSKIIDLLWNKN